MTLEKSIRSAIDLTLRLEAALEVGDMDLCRDLLEIRGEAMAAFERVHRGSPPLLACQHQDLVDELIAVDGKLQAKYQKGLENTAGEFRKALTSGSGIPGGAYNSNATSACIDRKA
jgi:hypothetical protein